MFMFKIRPKSTDLLFEQNVKKVSFSEQLAFLRDESDTDFILGQCLYKASIFFGEWIGSKEIITIE